MTTAQIGNVHGFAAAGSQSALLASVTADNATDNVVNVDSLAKLKVGMSIDILNRSTGSAVGGASARTITKLEDDGGTLEVTYSGADVDPTNAYGIYLAGTYGDDASVSNFNGGISDTAAFDLSDVLGSLDKMRTALTAISSTTYSAAELNKMTYNDMVYALRLHYAEDSITQ